MAASARAIRAIALFHDEDKLRCPAGHPLPRNVWTPVLTAVRCVWRSEGPRSPECGSIVLLFALTDGLRCVVEISHVEARYIELNRLTPAEAARYLGLSWTPDRAIGGTR
jgi:hypothetical protein